MISQIRAELLKIRSTRTTAGLLLGLIGLVLLFSLLTGFLTSASLLSVKENQLSLVGDGTIAGVFSALAGIMLVTSERVGDIAFAAGIPLHELVSEGSSLEEVFLELTSEPEK